MSCTEIMFKNCLQVKKKGKYYFPLRFTDRQIAEYMRSPQEWVSECKYNSGICLEFSTDSQTIEFDFIVDFTFHGFADFDIYENSTFVKSKCFTVENKKEYHFEYKRADNSMADIVIYLPHSASVLISDVTFDENSTVSDVAHKDCILCLGDSITQGAHALYPSSTYPARLGRHYNCSVINQAVSGYVFNREVIDEAIDIKPQFITVAYGTNDWWQEIPYEKLNENIIGFIDKIAEKYSKVPVFVITPLWRKDYLEVNKTGSFFDMVAMIIRACSKHSHITVVDGMTLVPHEEKYFGDKELHPDDNGYGMYAYNLIKEINKVYKNNKEIYQ